MTEALQFVLNGFKTYSGSNKIWFLFPVALIYLLIAGGKEARRVFVYPVIALMLTVFNPLVCRYLMNRSVFNKRYHRFFWLVLFYFVIGYAAVHVIFRFQKKYVRVLLTIAAAALIVLLGNPVFVGKGAYKYVMAKTIEFAPKEHVALSKVIHSEGLDRPRVLFDMSLVLTYRAYDPDVTSVMTREHLLKITSHSKEQFLELNMKPSLTSLFLVTYYSDTSVPFEAFIDACSVRNVDYIVIRKGASANGYVQEAGFTLLGETENFKVWKNVYRVSENGKRIEEIEEADTDDTEENTSGFYADSDV